MDQVQESGKSHEVYEVYYQAAKQHVVMNWTGYATSREFRQGTELMLNVLIQNRAAKVLGNIKDMVIIGMEDQQWVEKDFLPRAIQFGFRALALVNPTHYFNKVAAESISFKVDKEKITIKFFDSIEEGVAWLDNFQPVTSSQ